MDELKDLKEKIENKTLCYHSYYLQPFHGYDDGNLNWEAAQNEAAALSMLLPIIGKMYVLLILKNGFVIMYLIM